MGIGPMTATRVTPPRRRRVVQMSTLRPTHPTSVLAGHRHSPSCHLVRMSWLELHHSFGPGGIGAAVDTGKIGLPVVGLDRADGGEHCPWKAGARGRGFLVERQHGGRDLGRGGRGRRRCVTPDTEQRDGRGHHRGTHKASNGKGCGQEGDKAPHEAKPAGVCPLAAAASPPFLTTAPNGLTTGGGGRRSNDGHS